MTLPKIASVSAAAVVVVDLAEEEASPRDLLQHLQRRAIGLGMTPSEILARELLALERQLQVQVLSSRRLIALSQGRLMLLAERWLLGVLSQQLLEGLSM